MLITKVENPYNLQRNFSNYWQKNKFKHPVDIKPFKFIAFSFQTQQALRTVWQNIEQKRTKQMFRT